MSAIPQSLLSQPQVVLKVWTDTHDKNGLEGDLAATEAAETPVTPLYATSPNEEYTRSGLAQPSIEDDPRCAKRHAESKTESDKPLVIWDENGDAADNAHAVGQALLEDFPGAIFRREGTPATLMLVEGEGAGAKLLTIQNPDQLQGLLHDRLRFLVIVGKSSAHKLSRSWVKELLYAPAFQRQIPLVDLVSRLPVYGADFQLCRPGYNDAGSGKRVLYLGPTVKGSDTTKTLDRLLDGMDFDSEADRTNALAAALTVLTRLVFSPKTPLVLVTATKSHAGKGTVLQLACGGEQPKTMTLQNQDWATEKNLVTLLTAHPELPMIAIDNVRLEGRSKQIASAFLEKFLTDDENILYCTGSGNQDLVRRTVILAMTTNHGDVIEDLLNRSLPVHLAPKGDVSERQHGLGNLGAEFIPQHREQILAELVGIVERWKGAGKPLKEDATHSFSVWAKHIGGMLKKAGFHGFLDNMDRVRHRNDPIKAALGSLGYATKGEPQTTTELLILAARLGFGPVLLGVSSPACNQSEVTRFGKLLAARINETFHHDEEGILTVMRLSFAQKRRNSKAKGPERLYTFETVGE